MDQIENSYNVKIEENSTTILFLGLFLLILCFFILLVSISSVEESKSEKVMNSLSSTFADVSKPVTAPVDFMSKSGEALGPEAFLAVMEGVFTTAIKVDKVRVVQPGRIMTLRIQVQELFPENEFELRPSRYDLIDRIVASLAAPAAGLRFEMVMIMESSVEEEAGFLISETLEMKRVGDFLRTIIERGANPAVLSGGVKPGDSSEITIKFSVHDVEIRQPDVPNKIAQDRQGTSAQ